jgi:hypothetical protein
LLLHVMTPVAELRKALVLMSDDQQRAYGLIRHAYALLLDSIGALAETSPAPEEEEQQADARQVTIAQLTFDLYLRTRSLQLHRKLQAWQDSLERIIENLGSLPPEAQKESDSSGSVANVRRAAKKLRRALTKERRIPEGALQVASQLRDSLKAFQGSIGAAGSSAVSENFSTCLAWMDEATKSDIGIEQIELAMHRAHHYFLSACKAFPASDSSSARTDETNLALNQKLLAMVEDGFYSAIESVMQGTAKGGGGTRAPRSPRAGPMEKESELKSESNKPSSPRESLDQSPGYKKKKGKKAGRRKDSES